jgi:hypothetical protein
MPPISDEEMTPVVKVLIAWIEKLTSNNAELTSKIEEYAGMILALRESVQVLKDEIAVLKGQKPRPKIPPNKLDKDTSGSSGSGQGKGDNGKRFPNFTKWLKHLSRLGIVSEKEQRLATEGTLIGSLVIKKFYPLPV